MTAAQRTEASAWSPAYGGIFGACSGGSVSFRRAPGSNVLRWVLNCSYFQVSSGCDAAGSPPRPRPPPRPATGGGPGAGGGPLTTGAENCIEVSLRIRTTKSRISTDRARRVSASAALSWRDGGAGNAFHMACSVAMGPTSAARGRDGAADSPRIPQINGKYFGETICARATLVSVAAGFPSATRCLYRQAASK